MTDPRSTPSRARRFGRWITTQVGTATVAVLVGAGITALLLTSDDTPLPVQLDRQMKEATKSGATVMVNREVDLHGTGSKSRLIVLRPKDTPKEPVGSDEIRVF